MKSAPTRSVPLFVRLVGLGLLGLTAALGGHAWRDWRRSPPPDAPRLAFTLDGLDCPVWCAVRLTESIDGLDGARVESLDQRSGTVVVRHDPARQDRLALQRSIRARGFAVRSIASVPSPEACSK